MNTLQRVAVRQNIKALLKDVPLVVEQDEKLSDAVRSLVEQLAETVERLAKETGSVARDETGFIDLAFEHADNAVRTAVYDAIKDALTELACLGRR